MTALNKKTNESATYCWSADNRIGKKVVLASGFEVKKKQMNDLKIRLFLDSKVVENQT